MLKRASSEKEARWNYAFWLQNSSFCFGDDDTSYVVKKWLEENNFPYYDDGDGDEEYEEAGKITSAFVSVLVSIVREIHEQNRKI